ncbi:MAG: hypothetical protein IJ946_03155 [Clostridia bacterium]|nr:hypothetical protein [Clostridia bacterium]
MHKILILGSDKRSLTVYEILKEKHYDVSLLTNYEQLKEGFTAYLLPIPATLDGVKLNCDLNITVNEILTKAHNDSLIISAGFKKDGIIDITDNDDFAYQNAVPTAEGAISLAIGSNGSTLADSNILVTGFGRVSKVLLARLKAFSKNITVAVRKAGDLSLINALGFNALPVGMLAERLKDFDIIFNTIPYKLFNSETLYNAKEKAVFIELASNASGFDTDYIKALPVTFINAPGLPAKVAPTSAGKILAEAVITTLTNSKNIG